MPFEQHLFHKGRKKLSFRSALCKRSSRLQDLTLKAIDLTNTFLKENKAFFNRVLVLSFLEQTVGNKQKNGEINMKHHASSLHYQIS